MKNRLNGKIKINKILMKTSGKSWARYIDKSIKAKKVGYRKSSETGEMYYEARPNRSDANRKDKYEDGGMMAKGGSLKSIAKKYEQNEDDNAHSENVILLAKHFGTADDLKEAKRILALHNREGHLSSENGKKRYELHTKLIAKARKEMEAEGIKFAKGGAIYKGDKVRIKDSNKSMVVREIAKGKKGYVEFSGDKGTYLKGDLERFAKGGKTKKRKDPPIVRGYFEDEPYEYGSGGKMKKFSSGGLTGENARVKNLTDEYASESLRDEFRKKSKIKGDNVENHYVIAFAYTDYGGDFFDKVAIAYFEENYPNNIVVENSGYGGQNALVWGTPAEEFIEQTEDSFLGFEDIEEFYFQMENEETYKSFEYYLDDLARDYEFDKEAVMDWLMENKSGYYSLRTDGLDFSYSSLTDELELEGLIEKEKMAKGGLLGGFNYSIGGL